MNLPATVTVTAEHIKGGIPRQCDLCPIALALIEAIRAITPEDFEVSVYPGFTVVALGAAIWSAQMPEVADTFISNFDCAGIGEPFTFALEWIEGNMS